VTLCPRAIRILARQLKLRARLKAAGLIDHEHLFFTAEGGVIRSFVTCSTWLVDGVTRCLACSTFVIAARTPHAIHP
jgi:hypothetical protein